MNASNNSLLAAIISTLHGMGLMGLVGSLPTTGESGVLYSGDLKITGGFVGPVVASGQPSWATATVTGTTVTVTGTPP